MISFSTQLRTAITTVGLSWFTLTVIGADDSVRGPAPTLASVTSDQMVPDADGFIRRWLILEPIPTNGLTESLVQAAVKTPFFLNQVMAIPRDGEREKVGELDLSWHAVDTKLYNINLYHFAYALNKLTSNVLFWAVTVVNCTEEIPGVRLAIGSNAASIWWVNGQEVIGLYNDRQTTIDDGISRRLTLKKGSNVVRCAIVNGGGATDFCARFLGADQKPFKRFTLGLSVVANPSER